MQHQRFCSAAAPASCSAREMELLPILGPEDPPRENQWYCLVPRGAGPGVSVGHTCTYMPSRGGKGRIVIVGGANPNGSFSDSYVINLDGHEWDIPDWPGLQARYEHCSFVPESDPESLWVFAGAEQSGNRNCIQVLHTADSGPWKTVEVKGQPPKPRTYHTNSACVGDRLFVFSGGEAGATPVTDPQVHIFDTVTSTWSQPEIKGKPPSPRHGHVIIAAGTKIHVHGGMTGERFHTDMFSLDTENMKWERVKAKGDVPPGTAAHSAVALGKNIYIFGGMTAEGATNSMYKFQSDKQRWTLMTFEGDLPPDRLDHSMCVVPWSERTDAGGEKKAERSEGEMKHLCFVFGGMDTQGVIFNDCLVTVIT
ncbi:rab9 effector protein with kelch motifs [Pygocentrus nattereri]|uniref:Rab9 effector protein with kelch motifs n=1 Tax=Pygocentrus nattereri TaxID=42514 RepID=A0A3B4D9S1_PYGNA|nr:rab9 effector protein with kelch motifs [Pygocentrus nattereri]